MPGRAEPTRAPAQGSGSPTEFTVRERIRLAGIMARLASPFEGERAAAGLLASAFVERHGLGWSDVINLLGPVSDAKPVLSALPRVRERRTPDRGWRGYERRRRVQSGLFVNLSL